ncbi:MAG TPA: succinate dehydrogenase cytochrome b subunit [Blastocatellia bacterium]|nr:succinate dehydrogenase cytochrome b subunit [Blastocatellia bacterium]
MAAKIEVKQSAAAQANLLVRFFQSSLGKKYIVAITGFLLFGFVIVHMLGNLQFFLGPDAINAYAKFLKSTPELLWPARIGLLVIVILHIVTAVKLWQENRAARPVKYDTGKPPAASFASRTLIVSGLIIFAFIVFHLAHFTVGLVNPALLELRDPKDPLRHNVYQMMVDGFSNPWVSIFYIVAMGLLCLHLSHGVSSMFQSLGLKNRAWDGAIDRFAKVASAAIFIGNCAIVIAAWTGLVR